jgi:AcrR family transcriptional regulator
LPETENWFNIHSMPATAPPSRTSAPTEGAGSPSGPQSGYAKSRETRARILAAALAEASLSGFHKTSVARIAARAGVAVGNLNYHFGSRRDLLRELMKLLMADLMTRLHDADANDHADFFERQRAGMLAYLDYLRANPAHVRLADEIKLHEPELHREGVTSWVERMEERIRTGIEEGCLRPMDDTEVTAQAHFLLGARHFIENMLEGGDVPDHEAVVDAFLRLVRDGLHCEPAERKR